LSISLSLDVSENLNKLNQILYRSGFIEGNGNMLIICFSKVDAEFMEFSEHEVS
jgi:hypothetical protein